VQSDVPTLLLNGLFDIQTPARYADQVASTLSHAQKAVFPLGHVAISRDICPNTIISQFLDDPSPTVDLSCIDRMKVRFLLPDDFNTAANTLTSRLSERPFLSPGPVRHGPPRPVPMP